MTILRRQWCYRPDDWGTHDWWLTEWDDNIEAWVSISQLVSACLPYEARDIISDMEDVIDHFVRRSVIPAIQEELLKEAD